MNSLRHNNTPLTIGARHQKRSLFDGVLIDGRRVPGLVEIFPDRCLAVAHALDRTGLPILTPDGRPIVIRHAGKIEIIDAK